MDDELVFNWDENGKIPVSALKSIGDIGEGYITVGHIKNFSMTNCFSFDETGNITGNNLIIGETMKTYTVYILDPDRRIPDEMRLIKQIGPIFTYLDLEKFNMKYISMNEILRAYNETRTNIVDKEATQTAGKEIKMLPLTMEEVKIHVKECSI